ncbi:MAG: GDSL-type esterase/lipase family protein [Pseudomonadota bacterium]
MRKLAVALLAALALSAAPAFFPTQGVLEGIAYATPIPVSAGTKIVVVGDSITFQGWFSDTESLVGGTGLLVNQLIPPLRGARPGVLAGNASTLAAGAQIGRVGSVTGGGQVAAINSGISQNKVADIEAAIPARITNYNPAVVIVEVGVNDNRGLNSGIPTPLATFRTSYDNVLATTLSTLPSVRIVCVSILLIQEHWATGPPPIFSGNPYDVPSGGGFTPSITEYNTEIQGSCVAHGGTFIDVRTPAALAESTMNTPAPGAVDGVLTGAADGIHPSAAGQLIMSTAVAAAFVAAP